MFFRGRSNYWIVAAARERMAAQDSGKGHPPAAYRAVTLNRLHRIFRASRHVAAGRRQQGRDRPLVAPQQLQRDEFGPLIQDRLPASGSRLSGTLFRTTLPATFCDSFCSMTAKERLTSFNTAEKSAASNDFLGLITTSAAIPLGG